MVSELIVTNIVVSGKGIYLMVTIACLNIVTVLQLNHDNFRWFCEHFGSPTTPPPPRNDALGV